MKNLISLLFLMSAVSCTTLHFRSQNSIPVSFKGNPNHKSEISIVGHRSFYFWGLNPEHEEVIIDEEVRKAGYDGISKLIIYENKDPQDILISFLTFGVYLPRAYTITGFSTGTMIPQDVEDTSPPTVTK